MDKRAFNERLNGLKEAYPSEVALIEGIQKVFNQQLDVISDSNRVALRRFPTQFSRRINTGNGEWTTQLHMWADNLVPEMLEVDPLTLTCSDSGGNTVLHALVQAATGKYTQQVDYGFIQKLLDKNMDYVEMARPNDLSSKVEGSAWLQKDALGKTPMDYLVDFANGEDDSEADPELMDMLSRFGQGSQEEPPVDTTPVAPPSDQEAQMAAQASVQGDPGAPQAPAQPDLTTVVQDRQMNAEVTGSEPLVGVSPAQAEVVPAQQPQQPQQPVAQPRQPVAPQAMPQDMPRATPGETAAATSQVEAQPLYKEREPQGARRTEFEAMGVLGVLLRMI